MDSYLVLFAFVLAEQIGLPVPAVPLLLGVGAFAGTGRMSVLAGLATALVASLPPDVVWYELGRARGKRVLDVICRVSLEPDSCVRRTENLFLRRGRWALLVAKFLPGLSTIAPPLAGIVGLGRAPFLLLDTMGALLWAGAWIALGYVSSSALTPLLALAGRLGHWGLAAAGVGAGRLHPDQARPAPALPAKPPGGAHRALGAQAPARRRRPGPGRRSTPAPRSTWAPHRTRSPVPSGSRRKRSRAAARRSRSIGRSCSTAPDPTRPRAPGWRSCSSGAEPAGCTRSTAASPAGSTPGSRSKRCHSPTRPSAPPRPGAVAASGREGYHSGR